MNEVAQLCPTLCHPIDCSLPGSSVPWDFPGDSAGVDCHWGIKIPQVTCGATKGKKKEFGFNSKCDEAPLHGCRWGNIGSGVL